MKVILHKSISQKWYLKNVYDLGDNRWGKNVIQNFVLILNNKILFKQIMVPNFFFCLFIYKTTIKIHIKQTQI